MESLLEFVEPVLIELLLDIVAAELVNESDLLLGELCGSDVVKVSCLLVLKQSLLESLGDVAKLLAALGNESFDTSKLLLGQGLIEGELGFGIGVNGRILHEVLLVLLESLLELLNPMLIELLLDIVAAELVNESDLLLGELCGSDVVKVSCLLVLKQSLLESLGDVAKLLAALGNESFDTSKLLLGQGLIEGELGSCGRILNEVLLVILKLLLEDLAPTSGIGFDGLQEVVDKDNLILGDLGRDLAGVKVAHLLVLDECGLELILHAHKFLVFGSELLDTCNFLLGKLIACGSATATAGLEDYGCLGIFDHGSQMSCVGLGHTVEVNGGLGAESGETVVTFNVDIHCNEVDLGEVGAGEYVVSKDYVSGLVVENTGQGRAVKECLGGKSVDAGNEIGGGKGRAVCKCSAVDVYSIGSNVELNGGKLCATLERRSAEAEGFTLKDYGGESGIHECLLTDGADRSGYGYGAQSAAAIEEFLTDGALDTGVEGYACKACAVLEYSDGGEIGDGSGNDQVNDACALVHIGSELVDTHEVNHLSEGRAVEEQLGTDGGESDSSFINGYGSKRCAVCKCSVADGLDAGGNDDGAKLTTSLECAVADGGNGCGDNNDFKVLRVLECVVGDGSDVCGVGNGEGLESGARKCAAKDLVNGGGQLVGLCGVSGRVVDKSVHILIEECAVLVDVAGVTGVNGEGGNAGAVGEGVAAHAGKSCGEGYLLDLHAVLKGKLTDGGKTDGEGEILNVIAVCEGASADGADSIGEYNACKSGAAVECIGANGSYVGEADAGNGTVLKCVVTEAGNGGGKVDGGKSSCAVKCIVGDGLDLASVSEGYLCKGSTSAECGRTDGGNACGNGDLGERRAVLECVVSNGCKLFGENNGCKLNTVCKQICGNGGHSGGKYNVLESHASVEELVSKGSELVTVEDNGLEVVVLTEGLSSDGAYAASLCKFDGQQGGVVSVVVAECIVTDGGNGCGDVEGGECAAVYECTCVNGGNTLFDNKVCQLGAALECVGLDGLKGSGDGQRGDLAKSECLGSDGGNSVRNINALDTGVAECILADGLEAGSAGEGDACKRGLAAVSGECVATDGFNGSGDDEHLKCAVIECSVLNGFQSVRKLDESTLEVVECGNLDGGNALGDDQHLVVGLSCGSKVDGSTVSIIEDTVNNLEVGVIIADNDILKSRATCSEGLCTGIGERGKAVGKNEGLKSGVGAVVGNKQAGANSRYGIGEGEAGELAVCKCLLTDVLEIVTCELNGGKSASVKGVCTDGRYVLWNGEGGDLRKVSE